MLVVSVENFYLACCFVKLFVFCFLFFGKSQVKKKAFVWEKNNKGRGHFSFVHSFIFPTHLFVVVCVCVCDYRE